MLLFQKRWWVGVEWLLLAAIIALATLGTYRKINTAIQQQFPLTYDLACYYVTAHALNAGLSPYDIKSMDQTAAKLGVANYGEYVYPPFWGTIVRPIASFSINQLKLFWVITNLILLCISVVLLAIILKIPKIYLAIIIPAILMFPPIYDTILGGNVNIILLFLISSALFFSVSNDYRYHKIFASLFLGVAIGIKVYPVVLLFAYAVYKKGFIFIGTIITTISTFIIGILARGSIDTTLYWVSNVIFSIPSKLISYADVSLFAVSDRLFTARTYATFNGDTAVELSLPSIIEAPFAGKAIGYGLAAIIVMTTCISIIKASHRPTLHSFIIAFNLLLTMLLIITPRVWDHYYVLITVPFLYLAKQYYDQPIWRIGLGTIIICILLQRFTSKFVVTLQSPLVTCFSLFAGIITWMLLLRINANRLYDRRQTCIEANILVEQKPV
jgi:hypothetical protein